ncbi:UNVERIFIED_CONTAM: Ubiquitin domain-containing protein UBFD1 [Trichonephila clavipes]
MIPKYILGACGSADGTPVGSFEEAKELVDFKLIFNKKKHDICFPLDENILALKKHFESLIGVPASMQKVMYKGLCKDDKTLREVSITKGAKVMVVGSTLSDIIAVNTPSEQDLKEEKAAAATKEPLCKQKMHKKILDKGVPEDIQPGIKNAKDSLPPFPLSGMVNKSGGKVRLTFKLELDQVWIGTKERTDKIPMNSIKTIVSEPIEGHEEYHIMVFYLKWIKVWIHVVNFVFYLCDKEAIKYRYTIKKSHGVKSGDLGGQALRRIQCFGRCWFYKSESPSPSVRVLHLAERCNLWNQSCCGINLN